MPCSQPPTASRSDPLPECHQPGLGNFCLLPALLGSSLPKRKQPPQGLGLGA